MGFLTPADPPVEIEEWKRLSHLDRVKPLAQDWALSGFGTPWGVFLLYLVKSLVYLAGALFFISGTTAGIGGLGEIGDWWTEPIVFQKLIVWTLLWEIAGLGAGALPLTFRFNPPIGGVLHWFRPGTIRLPPWPGVVPLTAGNRRTLIDVALYAGIVGSALFLLSSDGEPAAGFAAGVLAETGIIILLACLVALGLRDKVPFLAARSEHYGTLLVVFLFGSEHLLVASQLVFVALWFGAAFSKLNHHFPFVVTVMTSNSPWNRSRTFKRLLYRDHPEDLRPSRFGRLLAHGGTTIEFVAPLILLVTSGGTVAAIAVVAMVLFHTHIYFAFPLAVPQEWNLVMIFGVLFLFGEYGDVPLSTLDNPWLIAFLAVVLLAIPLYGNFRPDKISFLAAMRYYAGNWATSQWYFRRDTGAEAKLDATLIKSSVTPVEQLDPIYGREMAELLLGKGYAFRCMHSHGRALAGLMTRAVDDPEAYDIREGELISGIALGYNFGDGHFHHEQLLEVIQELCRFEPGELRVVMLEAEPAFSGKQHYRVHDAATGLVEEGYVRVADMVRMQPWLEESGTIPVELIGSDRAGAPAGA